MPGTGLPSNTGPNPAYSNATSPYGLDPNSSNYASDSLAAATRQQWSDYINTFVPIENKLIQYATDPTQPGQAMAAASTGVQQAFQAQQGTTQRQLKALGTSLTPDEQQASTRATGLQQSLADVGAQNTARDLTVQRQQGILGSPAPQGV
jgi:hypothetical protein